MEPENNDIHPHSKLEALTDDFKAYITTIYELNKLKLIDKLSSAAASVTVYIAGTILAVFTLLFTSVGAALWIGECLHSTFSGFFIVAGIYLIITLFVLLGKNNGVKRTVSGTIIKNALDQN